MSEKYNLTEVARILAITPKKLQRLLANTSIKPKNNPQDKRRYELTHEQVEQIAALLGTTLKRVQETSRERETIETLSTKVGRMEKELQNLNTRYNQLVVSTTKMEDNNDKIQAALRRLLTHSTLTIGIPQQNLQMSPIQPFPETEEQGYQREVSTNHSTQYPQLPPGWTSLSEFCYLYNLPESTIKRKIRTGLIQCHKGTWKRERTIIRWALDPNEQAALITAK